MDGRDFFEEEENVEHLLDLFERAKAEKPCDRYYCPTSGETECTAHSGFDVCCARPDLHIRGNF